MSEPLPDPNIGIQPESNAPPRAPAAGVALARRIGWITPLVFLVNLAAMVLLVAYSLLNLLPDLPVASVLEQRVLLGLAVLLAVVAPAVASRIQVRPVLRWLRPGASPRHAEPSADVARRAANTPFVVAAYSLFGWVFLTLLAVVRWVQIGPDIGLGVAAHLVLRPLLAGLIVATATVFAAESLCRAYVWPTLLAGTRIAGNRRLWRMRISHRLLALWLAISVVPLGAVALTTYARIVGENLAIDPLLGRVVAVVLLIAISSAVGGAWLAWTVSRSITQPLEALETATAALSAGRFDTRVVVNTTDEFGALAEGFNLAALRLARSYTELETRNRELAQALDRVAFLEHVKHALDRFVPEAVRHAIEANPDSPALAKEARDVTVLFLDIEGYVRLSEELPRPVLNALVERYFSLFLASIRNEGGDINETSGDGLMIIFQAGGPEAHAAAALRAALAIQAQTAKENRSSSALHPQIRINIGISSGECDVGTTRLQGPAGERWTFTASGPVTNLAARLSDHAKGGKILLSDETRRRIRDRFPLRDLGPVLLKNLPHPVQAWEAQAPAG